MRNILKIKKRKITIFMLLIFNQFLFNSYAVNLKKIYQANSTNNILKNNINKNFDTLLVENKNGESQNLIQEAKEIEEFVENVFNSDYSENSNNQNKQVPSTNIYIDEKSNQNIINKIDNKNSFEEENNKPYPKN